MQFADDLFQLYLRHFNDSESESLELFIESILEQMDHNDILKILHTCPKDELAQILCSYLNHNIVQKLEEA